MSNQASGLRRLPLRKAKAPAILILMAVIGQFAIGPLALVLGGAALLVCVVSLYDNSTGSWTILTVMFLMILLVMVLLIALLSLMPTGRS